MQPDSHARSRLSVEMNKRRLELRLRWNQVAERASISIAHLSRIRNGEAPLSDLAKSSIETALEWPPGAIGRLLDEGDPQTPHLQGDQRPRGKPESPAKPDLSILPPDLSEIENPTPAEAAMLAILAATKREIETLREEVRELRSERDQDSRDQKGA